jgi:hypothetical protein
MAGQASADKNINHENTRLRQDYGGAGEKKKTRKRKNSPLACPPPADFARDTEFTEFDTDVGEEGSKL